MIWPIQVVNACSWHEHWLAWLSLNILEHISNLFLRCYELITRQIRYDRLKCNKWCVPNSLEHEGPINVDSISSLKHLTSKVEPSNLGRLVTTASPFNVFYVHRSGGSRRQTFVENIEDVILNSTNILKVKKYCLSTKTYAIQRLINKLFKYHGDFVKSILTRLLDLPNKVSKRKIK